MGKKIPEWKKKKTPDPIETLINAADNIERLRIALERIADSLERMEKHYRGAL